VFGRGWQQWILGQRKYHGDVGGRVLRCLEVVGAVDGGQIFGLVMCNPT
jgi:hypothetical protein